MHLLLPVFLVTVFLFSLTASKFLPQKSTKNLSQKLQRFSVIRDSETVISLFARPSLKFLLLKKIGINPMIRIQNFDQKCLASTQIQTKSYITIEFSFNSGSKILIKNGYNFKKFGITSNCGDFGPMEFYQNFGETRLNGLLPLMDLCLKQYKKIDENYEAVEVKVETNVKCGFFMALGKNTYISDIPTSNIKLNAEKFITFNSNKDIPKMYENLINFDESLNQIEMDLKQVLPKKIGFVGEKFFGIPSFRFEYDNNCGNSISYLQFYDNKKCMATVYLDSSNNFIIETSYGTILIPKNVISKTKFFADFSKLYYVTEPSDSYSAPEFFSLLLCEIIDSNNLIPYFKITKVKSNLNCTKSKIIFGGSLLSDENEKITLFTEKDDSPWLAALPYFGILCFILLLAIASFLTYFCIRHRRRQLRKEKKVKQEQQKKLLPKLPTAEEEKDLEPHTLSQIIDKEFVEEEMELKPKSKPFKVIVPGAVGSPSSKPLSPPTNSK